MKDTLILKDGSTIELEASSSITALQVASDDRTTMLKTWERLTDENLAEVQIKISSGLVVGKYTDLVLVSETSIVDTDGTVKTTYSMREKSDVEKRLDNLETVQKIQDGAIEDLGEVVGILAEGGEV